jgi:hypothetical protein
MNIHAGYRRLQFTVVNDSGPKWSPGIGARYPMSLDDLYRALVPLTGRNKRELIPARLGCLIRYSLINDSLDLGHCSIDLQLFPLQHGNGFLAPFKQLVVLQTRQNFANLRKVLIGEIIHQEVRVVFHSTESGWTSTRSRRVIESKGGRVGQVKSSEMAKSILKARST